MTLLKFKNFEELERMERKGEGIKWQFAPDDAYFKKLLRYKIKVPFPHGVYKFKSFEEADEWERDWWMKSGITKRTD